MDTFFILFYFNHEIVYDANNLAKIGTVNFKSPLTPSTPPLLSHDNTIPVPDQEREMALAHTAHSVKITLEFHKIFALLKNRYRYLTYCE